MKHAKALLLTLAAPMSAGQVTGCVFVWLAAQVPVRDVARPGTEKRVSGEGMPVSKTPGTKGDLRIRFDVQFPRALTEQQKAGLRQLLPSD